VEVGPVCPQHCRYRWKRERKKRKKLQNSRKAV
jgi:hypothetical protein